jgi:hypothetical protein
LAKDRYVREAVTAGDRGEGVLMLAQLSSSRVKSGAGMRATFLIGHEVDAFSIEPSHSSGDAPPMCESLRVMCVSTAPRSRAWIRLAQPDLLRLSAEIEDLEDLWRDIDRALSG